MKAFIGINVIMGINNLPSAEDYWSTGKSSEMTRFETTWQEQGISPTYRIFTFPITTITIKLIKQNPSCCQRSKQSIC